MMNLVLFNYFNLLFSVVMINHQVEFLHNLNLSECNTVIGGYMYFRLFNIGGGINNIENIYYTGAYSFNFHDNKIYTIDYSRSVYNWLRF